MEVELCLEPKGSCTVVYPYGETVVRFKKERNLIIYDSMDEH